MQTPTLYDWAGSKEVLDQLTKLFYEKFLKDDLLYPVFKEMAPDHSQRMIQHHIRKMRDENKRKRWMDLLLQVGMKSGWPMIPGFALHWSDILNGEAVLQ